MTIMVVLITACLIIVGCVELAIFARMKKLGNKVPKRARIMKGCATVFALMAQGFSKEAAMEYAARDITINKKEELDELIAACADFQEKAVQYKQSLEYKRESA